MSSPRPLNEGIMTTTAELNYSTSKNNITDNLLLHVTESGGIYDGDGHCHDFDSTKEVLFFVNVVVLLVIVALGKYEKIRLDNQNCVKCLASFCCIQHMPFGNQYLVSINLPNICTILSTDQWTYNIWRVYL